MADLILNNTWASVQIPVACSTSYHMQRRYPLSKDTAALHRRRRRHAFEPFLRFIYQSPDSSRPNLLIERPLRLPTHHGSVTVPILLVCCLRGACGRARRTNAYELVCSVDNDSFTCIRPFGLHVLSIWPSDITDYAKSNPSAFKMSAFQHVTVKAGSNAHLVSAKHRPTSSRSDRWPWKGHSACGSPGSPGVSIQTSPSVDLHITTSANPP